MSSDMVLSVLIALVSAGIGFMVAKIVYEGCLSELMKTMDSMGCVIYELENRLMRKCGIPVTDEICRRELRESVASKASRVMNNEVDMNSEEE